MIISHTHRYVYVGIPRTGSKSMNHWLTEHFDGRWCGGHHSADVPAEADGYLVFTVVRNPYERAASGHFAVTWDDLAPTDDEIGPVRDEAERLRKFRAVLATRQGQVRCDPPRPSDRPLDERIREAVDAGRSPGHGMTQARFVARAGVGLVLYHERLPGGLAALPFVDADAVPPLPHHPERGVRPPGSFFEWFGDEDEQVVYAGAADDFEAFHYERRASGLPADAPDAMWIEP